MKKRMLSLLLAVVLVLSMVPSRAFAAETGAAITVSGNSYRNKYVVITDGTTDAVYYINSSGLVQNMDGTAASFAPGSYTIYYGPLGMMANRSFYKGTVTVGADDTNVTATLSRTAWSSASDAEKAMFAQSVYYNTSAFDHVDVRVAGSYIIHVGSEVYNATVSNPSVVVKVGGTEVASQTWSGTTSYEWRKTGLNLDRTQLIEIELTLTLTYTDSNGETHVLEDVKIGYDNQNDLDKFLDAIIICDGVAGLDFRVSVNDIEEEIQYYSVTYEWKVYNTDGTFTELPAGAPSEPAATSGHTAGEQYVYDTEYVTGTSFYDYENGLLYSFHGWDTYSHSDVFNVDPTAVGYHALDDGDADASNNQTIEITADTYIYGYWTVTELAPASAHIAIEKIFIVDGVEMTMEEAEDLWFRVDTGIDRDNDGDTTIDVDYPMLLAVNGEYKIPVYQYDTPFLFTEHNADVPGYTRTTTVTVSGDYIVDYTQNGDAVSVTMEPVYQGENVHLGTVTYINSYTKNVGEAVNEYPVLTLMKTAADTNLGQNGVVFTLYSDEECQNFVASVTTAGGGLGYLDFSAVENVTAGVYYLKETSPVAGYKADPHVYPIILTASEPVEELRDGEYVMVTYYTLHVTLPDGSTAAYQEVRATDIYYRLHIYNEPILGSLNVTKTTVGLDDKDALNAVVIVHGPITRDADGTITDIGGTWELDLNAENGWSAAIGELPVGEYLIHESFASVHGYTWTGVSYGGLETVVYNGITSGVFRVESETAIDLTLTNTYEQWTAADFYIKKVDPNGNALPGAVFQLFDMVDGQLVPITGGTFTTTATTGADGYAHFVGFTVPEGQESVTYYLKEIKAPDGFYLSDTVYKVVISTVTADGKTTYESHITLLSGENAPFDSATDLLTVVNYPVLGKLTVIKSFTGGIVPEDLTAIDVMVSGPGGYIRIVELNPANSWCVTLEDLVLGTYTITEQVPSSPGYELEVVYMVGETTAHASAEVTLTEQEPGKTVPGTEILGEATIINTYTRHEETYEIPTSLTVMKVGEDGTTPLSGAVFTLQRMDAAGENVIDSVSFTTGSGGKVVFDLLSGFIVNGEDIDGVFLLSETAAPDGYEKTDTVWKIVVKEDDGEIRVVLNQYKNLFENIWDWIVGSITGDGSGWTWDDDVLTVQNVKKVGELIVTKTVLDEENYYADGEYTFTLDCSDDAFDQTFTLKAGESKTIGNIPWGTTYTLTEDATGAAYTASITDSGSGRIWAEETTITVTNTYTYTTHNQPLALVKVDADDNTVVIPGAGFTLYADEACRTAVGEEVFSDENGQLALPISAPGTYYLLETTTPAGYHPNPNAYTVVAEQKYVVKNAGTADAVTEIQMHIRIQGLTGTTENQIDYTYHIENTPIKAVEVSVNKVWVVSEDVTHPEFVEVTLYRDGQAYDTVTLSGDNAWSHTWTELTDAYVWTVDEPSVPSGYSKTVRQDGYSFTVINAYHGNPQTGDAVSLLGLGLTAAVSGTGLCCMLPKLRKKKEDQQ